MEISPLKFRKATVLLEVTKDTRLAWTKAQHVECGNLLYADGSVLEFGNLNAKATAQMPAGVTNRLAIP